MRALPCLALPGPARSAQRGRTSGISTQALVQPGPGQSERCGRGLWQGGNETPGCSA